MMTFRKKTRFFALIVTLTWMVAACQSPASAEMVPVVTENDGEADHLNQPAEETEISSPTMSEATEERIEDAIEASDSTEVADSSDEVPTTGPATATPDTRLDPEDWRNWPIVPEISANAIDLYQQAVANGANPTHFSKIGDCQNVTSYFLADFDRGRYSLGEDYAYLQETIDYYAGSWKRESLSVQGGFNVASVMSPLRANPEFCETNESPVECEFRIHNPSIVIISLETWWNHDDPTKYEFYMRHLLDTVLELGVLPILATKADNLEGNHTINRSIAQLAYEYDIPLWNFWAATDPLPNHGLVETTVVDGEEVEDNFHLTIGLGNYFDDPDNDVAAWPLRNLTALQTIDAVYQAVKDLD